MTARRTPAPRKTTARPRATPRGAGGVTPPADEPTGPTRLRSPAGGVVVAYTDELAGHLIERGYRRV